MQGEQQTQLTLVQHVSTIAVTAAVAVAALTSPLTASAALVEVRTPNKIYQQVDACSLWST